MAWDSGLPEYVSNADCIKQLLAENVITAKEAIRLLKKDGYNAGDEAEEMVAEWTADKAA